jgi:hypothetical protein
MKHLQITFYLIVIFFHSLLNNCVSQNITNEEIHLNKITIPKAFKDTELSSIVWFKDSLLIILPENFNKNSKKTILFSINKDEVINSFVTGKIKKYDKISIEIEDSVQLTYAQGLEAICFSADTVFISLECQNSTAILLKGIFYPLENKINICTSVIIQHPLNEKIKNSTIESILYYNFKVYCFHECNGVVNNNFNSVVATYNTNLKFLGFTPLDELEYRLTDVSSVINNNFYALNFYFYENEFERYKPENDLLIKHIKDDFSHFTYIEDKSYLKQVERIVEYKITSDSVCLTDKIPYYLKLENEPRNIEGIEQIYYKNQQYFIIATDRFPKDNLYFGKVNE